MTSADSDSDWDWDWDSAGGCHLRASRRPHDLAAGDMTPAARLARLRERAYPPPRDLADSDSDSVSDSAGGCRPRMSRRPRDLAAGDMTPAASLVRLRERAYPPPRPGNR